MLSRLDLRGLTALPADGLPRPRRGAELPVDEVREIIERVERSGDQALLELTSRFDGVDLESLTVPASDLDAARRRVPDELREALELAAANIEAYHRAQLPTDVEIERDGMRLRGVHQAVERAGCYVPGGRAAYPSTVLMTVIPARVAGVGEVVVTVPPGPDGRVPDVTLAAASIAGASAVHPVGGAQAIAALAHGTESIAAVDVIVGPGNPYVAVAKRLVTGLVGVPSAFAGPSEVVVVADESTDPELAAIDLMLQAEHGPDGLSWLVTWHPPIVDQVCERLTSLVSVASRRSDIERTLGSSGHAVLCDTAQQALDVVNAIAPEHLELLIDSPNDLVPLVRHAGAVFCGPWTPASLGDYVAGPSHVLPTDGTARFAGALTVRDFMKDMHVVYFDETAFDSVAAAVITLAEAEGLDAHAESVRLRHTRSGSR